MLDAWATTTTPPGEVPGDTAVEQHQSARPLNCQRKPANITAALWLL